jgi:hypothetical protein
MDLLTEFDIAKDLGLDDVVAEILNSNPEIASFKKG